MFRSRWTHSEEQRDFLRHIGQCPPVAGLLRILAHRYVRDILPELQLQLATNALFGVEIAGIKPRLLQLFDTRGRGPASPAIDSVAAQGRIAGWCKKLEVLSAKEKKTFQPPCWMGCLLARRRTMVPKSID